MSYRATVNEVMIASPNDVTEERDIVRGLISEWNTVNSRGSQRVLLPTSWDTHAIPEMGDRPQAIINKQVLSNCDLLIGIFWTRIGTPTGDYASGSVEEIEEHIKAGKQTMLYFSSALVAPEMLDAKQYAKLQKFKQSCQARGLYESYSDLTDFRTKLNRQLQLRMNSEYFQTNTSNYIQRGGPTGEIVDLTKEAAVLLKECATDPAAQILIRSDLSGSAIQVNGKNVVEEGNDRSRAIWESALSELENAGFIEALGNNRVMFQITKVGYEAADLLLQTI